MQPGTAIGPFEILAHLGAGGMGEVFRARDTRLDREIAVKLLPAAFVADERAVERFSREARAASALNHPNIVTIYDIGESEHGRYIAMELVRGRTLGEIAEARRNSSLASELVAQCAEALAVAHEAGIVHRDIKPENVMVRDDGYVKVLDFGLARLVRPEHRTAPDGQRDSALTDAGMVLGTIRYLSPEQGCGEVVGSASDVFALGVVLYELLTGVHPFAASTTVAMLGAILAREIQLPSVHEPSVPAELDALVTRMLAKDPAERPTAMEVSNRLRELAGRGRRSTAVRAFGDAGQGRAGDAPDLAARRAYTARGHSASRVVGRENDRARLFAAFADAVHGHGSVLSIVGEPGIGKTTLVEDCLATIAAESFATSVARGRCSERLAGTEAYLPVLEALEDVLRRDRDSVVRQAMERVAPTWYANLRSESAERVAEGSTDLRAVSQEKMKREIAALLTEASRAQPVIFFIDDLHWADASTVDLLAYLAPRIAELRVLVVVTFRPSEMRMSKHPFLSVHLDLQARGIAHELALDFLSLNDVKEFLDLQYPGNAFPGEFARAIHTKTEGNPLFMVDVVRYLGAQGVIAEGDGRWQLARSVPDIDRDLPQSVRSMIERKIEQLDESDRRLLAAASVQGYEFDSAIVAAVLGQDAADVEEQLLTLERVYVFVTRIEERELPDRTLSVRYRFVHVLYQNTLYASLSASRRVGQSARVAEALERHYGARAAEVASELAPLYEAARNPARAAAYYAIAAQRASQVFAFAEAETLGLKGIAQVELLPEGAERIGLELGLRTSLGFTSLTRRGYAHPDTAVNMNRAREICHQLGEVPSLAPVLFGLCLYHVAGSNLELGHDAAQRLQRLAEGTGESAHRMVAHVASAGVLHYKGWPREGLEHFESARAHFDPARREADRARFFSDPYLIGACVTVRGLWLTGRVNAARERMIEAWALARITRDPQNRAFAALFAGELELELGQVEEAERITAEALRLCEEYGIVSERLWNGAYHGAALVRLGRPTEALAELELVVGTMQAIRGLIVMPRFCGYIAEALAALGRRDEAFATIEKALTIGNETGEHLWDSDLLRQRAELLLSSAPHPLPADIAEAAEDAYTTAIALAAERTMLPFELRASLGLAALWKSQGRGEEARALVEGVYARFPEATAFAPAATSGAPAVGMFTAAYRA